MKIRNGFVSNSSSSSFICEVCGLSEGGWDSGLSEVGMVECSNGHIMHEDCTIDHKKTQETVDLATAIERLTIYVNSGHYSFAQSQLDKLKQFIIDGEDPSDYIHDIASDWEWGMSNTNCPICQMIEITDSDIKRYFNRKYQQTTEQITKEIQKSFKTYEEFQAYLQGDNDDEE